MSADSNIEKFIIELGFADSKAVQGLKKFLKDVDRIGTKLDKASTDRSNKKASIDEAHVKARSKHLHKLYQEGVVRDKKEKADIDKKAADKVAADKKATEKMSDSQISAYKENQRREIADAKSKKQAADKKAAKKIASQEKIDNASIKSKEAAAKANIIADNKALKSKEDLHGKALEREASDRRKALAAKSKDEKSSIGKTDKAEADLAKRRSARARALVSSRRRARNVSGQGILGGAVEDGKLEGKNVRRTLQKSFMSGDTREVDKLRAAVRKYRRELRSTNGEIRRVTFSQRALTDSTRNMARQYLSVFAVLAGSNAINQTGQDFEGMRAAMLLSSGSAAQATKDLAFVNEEAKRLGLNLKNATDGFTKFQLSAQGKLDRGETRQLFSGFSEFATAAGVDKFRYEKGLQAIQQMMNKGQIMAEELKNQLAEQIPGALKAFELALGKSTAEIFKMMENGELMAEDVLPKVGIAFATLARQGGALEAQLASTRVAQGQFMTFAQEGMDTVFTSGFAVGFSGLLKSIGEDIGSSSDGLRGLGKVYELFFKLVKKASEILIPVLNAILSVLGGVSEMFLEIFSTSLGKILTGVGAITLVMTKLSFVVQTMNIGLMQLMARLFAIPYLLLGVAHEVKSMFDTDLTGLLEKFVFDGKQISSSSDDAKEFRNSQAGRDFNKKMYKLTESPRYLPSSSTTGKNETGRLEVNITSSDSNIKTFIESDNLNTFVTSG